MIKTIISVSALIGLLGLATSSANAEQPMSSPEGASVYGDWLVSCQQANGVPPCEMIQVAKDTQTNAQIMQMSLAYSSKDELYGIQIVIPLGVKIREGVLVRADDKSDISGIYITRCEMQGCYAEGVLSGESVKPLLDASRGLVAFIGRDGKPVTVQLSFKGFTEALKVMSERNRIWAQVKPR